MELSQGHVNERLKAYSRVVAKAWSDEEFKQRLLADPKATLQAEGVTVPGGAEVHIMESTDQDVYFSLPAKPAGLSTEELSGIAGGGPRGEPGAQILYCPSVVY